VGPGDLELSPEEQLRRAQAEISRAQEKEQLSARYKTLEASQNAADAAAAALGKSKGFKEALEAVRKLDRAAPRSVAAGVVCQLMERLETASKLLEAAKASRTLKDRELATASYRELGDAALRPPKRSSCFRVAHQNMGCCYGTNGGPKLLPGKVKHLLTLCNFFDVDAVVCTEMPTNATEVLKSALADSSKWAFRVSDAVSPEDANTAEHVAWIFNKQCVSVLGGPMLIEGWVRFTDASCTLRADAAAPHGLADVAVIAHSCPPGPTVKEHAGQRRH